MARHSENTKMVRQISLFSATILVIANMIGTGIFTTSGFIIQELGSPLLMLVCWFAGGLFALSGALCYGELGAIFPKAGGEYVFLKESFGQWVGFLSGWISLIVGFSAPIAAVSIAFATYLSHAFPLYSNSVISFSLFGMAFANLSPLALVAVCTIIIFSAVHYMGVSTGARIQNALTLSKIGIIIVFIATGLCMGDGSISHFKGASEVSGLFDGRFAVSLIFVSFAYSGWNAAAYIGGEIENPERNIPRALFYGTVLVMSLYLLLNIVLIYALSPSEMSGVVEVGGRAAAALFGARIGRYFDGAIAISLLSALSAMIMTGPRVYYAMSVDGVFHKAFRRINSKHHTPAHAVFLQAGVAVFMVVTASFENLLLYIGFTLSLSAMLTVAGLIRIRMKHLFPPAGYKVIGYPLTPAVFIIGNMWIIYFSVKTRPMTALAGLGTIVFGIIVYVYFSKFKRRVS